MYIGLHVQLNGFKDLLIKSKLFNLQATLYLPCSQGTLNYALKNKINMVKSSSFL